MTSWFVIWTTQANTVRTRWMELEALVREYTWGE